MFFPKYCSAVRGGEATARAAAFVPADGRAFCLDGLTGLSSFGFSALGFTGASAGRVVVPRPPNHHHAPPATAAIKTATAIHFAVVRLLPPVASEREGCAPSRPFPPSVIFVGEIPLRRHSAMHSDRPAASMRSSRNAPSLARYVTLKVIDPVEIESPPAHADGPSFVALSS